MTSPDDRFFPPGGPAVEVAGGSMAATSPLGIGGGGLCVVVGGRPPSLHFPWFVHAIVPLRAVRSLLDSYSFSCSPPPSPRSQVVC